MLLSLIAQKPSTLLRKNTKPQASSTVALGRTLIASQILAANEKGNTKLTVKVLGSSSLGAIITVADSQGERQKATFKIQVSISKRLQLVKS